jgi:hypothetical protein
MSISSLSFWQQNQNYWARAAQASQNQAQTDAVINNMFGASTTLSSGLASIANQAALSRVNSQLTSAVQSALDSINGGSSSTTSSQSSSSTSSSSSGSSSSSATSGSSSSAASAPAPAIGTGTVPLNTSTSLLTLGILAKGTITINDGTNTTTYQSTGSDTVGDLLNAINQNAYGKAQVSAWLDTSGKLTITAKNQTSTILVGGAYAPNIGFRAGNNFFQPTAPTPTSSSSSSSSSGSSSSSSSSSTSSTSSSTSPSTTSTTMSASTNPLRNSALALQSSATAEILLASNGLSGGSIVDLFA